MTSETKTNQPEDSKQISEDVAGNSEDSPQASNGIDKEEAMSEEESEETEEPQEERSGSEISLFSPEGIIMTLVAVLFDLIGIITLVLTLLFGLGQIVSWVVDILATI